MEESEEQLRTLCDLSDEDLRIIDSCKSNSRHIELLSVRALLKAVGIHQTIHYDDCRPYLDEGYISISHSSDVAAIIYSPDHPVAIDIEHIDPRIQIVAKRMFSDEELAAANGDLEKLTILWNCKECVFKLAQDDGIDFRKMIEVDLSYDFSFQDNSSKENPIVHNPIIHCTLKKSGSTKHFSFSAMKFEDNMVAWGREKG